jgi:hypothetical protein
VLSPRRSVSLRDYVNVETRLWMCRGRTAMQDDGMKDVVVNSLLQQDHCDQDGVTAVYETDVNSPCSRRGNRNLHDLVANIDDGWWSASTRWESSAALATRSS